MAVSRVKKEIMESYPCLMPIKKVADVEGTINGQSVRVVIKKGKVDAIRVDGRNEWVQGSDMPAMDYLSHVSKRALPMPVKALTVLLRESRGH